MAVVDVKLEKLSEVSMRDFSTFGRIIGRDEDTEEGKYELHPVDAKAAVENSMIKAYVGSNSFQGQQRRPLFDGYALCLSKANRGNP